MSGAVSRAFARRARELAARYPDAKVVLTVRDPGEWYSSMRSTVYETMTRPERMAGMSASDRAALELSKELVLDGFFEGKFEDREAAIAAFCEHNAAVQAALPSDRSLVYAVRDGWRPLCAFLGVDVPDAPFPNMNDRAQFRRRVGLPP